MARKIQILIELDTETKNIKTTGPLDNPALMLKVLSAVIGQLADGVQPRPSVKQKGKPDIILPDLQIHRS